MKLNALAAGAALLLAVIAAPAAADPVAVRLLEGNFRAFLVVHDAQGKAIAYGEQSQNPGGGALRTRLVLRFRDGSHFEEQATYTQSNVFRLERYHMVQRGPSFPTMDVTFDRRTGRYKALTQEKIGGEEKSASGTLEIPEDVYNGLATTLIKNLSGSGVNARMLAFTPEPIALSMGISKEGVDRVSVGGRRLDASRYLVKLDVTGLKGVFASLVGKDPPDVRYWMVAGDVPAFGKFEGAMFLNGPIWRLEQTPVQWPKGTRREAK